MDIDDGYFDYFHIKLKLDHFQFVQLPELVIKKILKEHVFQCLIKFLYIFSCLKFADLISSLESGWYVHGRFLKNMY